MRHALIAAALLLAMTVSACGGPEEESTVSALAIDGGTDAGADAGVDADCGFGRVPMRPILPPDAGPR